jgi:hypothetical protein
MAIQDSSSETQRQRPATSDRHESTSTISETARRAGGEASKITQDAQKKATAFLEGQKAVAADHLEGLSQPLHEAVDRLREKSPGLVSDYAQRAVDGLDTVTAALRDSSPNSMVRTVEDFARRQPAVFVAGSVAAGFVLARFLRSSSRASRAGEIGAGGQYASGYRAAHETHVEKEPR